MQKLYSTLLMLFTIIPVYGQLSDKIAIRTEHCSDFILGINNSFSVFAAQDAPVSVDDIKAFQITPKQYLYEEAPKQLIIKEEYSNFWIRPDSLGWIEFQLEINGKIEKTICRIKPMEAVPRFNIRISNDGKALKNDFIRIEGLAANVECCGFDAKCKMLEYEIIRIGANNIVSRSKNEGARFNEESLQLIKQAASGDIYVFRNIYYRCPGSIPKQQAEDLLFDIK